MAVRVSEVELSPFKAMIQKMHQAFQNKDFEALMAMHVSDENITSFGLTEDVTSKTALEKLWRDYHQHHSCSSKPMEEHYTVYQQGDVACLCLKHKTENDSNTNRIF